MRWLLPLALLLPGCSQTSSADAGRAAACAAQCPLGFTCQDGHCGPIVCASNAACPPPLTCIGGLCASDDCAPPCGAQLCISGVCVPAASPSADAGADAGPCPAGYTACQGPAGLLCVNVQTSAANCGACGKSCAGTCAYGACEPGADAGCAPLRGQCGQDSDCCSGGCSGTCCQPNFGDACQNDVDCCQGNCIGGLCCLIDGNSCDQGWCCSGNCSSNQCCPANTQHYGGPCATDSDCCPGVCVDGGCVGQTFASCGADPDCASGNCQDEHCCAMPNGLSLGSPCDAGSECCAGGCGGGGCCIPNGQPDYGGSGQTTCCSGEVNGLCCEPRLLGPCAADDDCCSGICSDGGCRDQLGGACATAADCAYPGVCVDAGCCIPSGLYCDCYYNCCSGADDNGICQ